MGTKPLVEYMNWMSGAKLHDLLGTNKARYFGCSTGQGSISRRHKESSVGEAGHLWPSCYGAAIQASSAQTVCEILKCVYCIYLCTCRMEFWLATPMFINVDFWKAAMVNPLVGEQRSYMRPMVGS